MSRGCSQPLTYPGQLNSQAGSAGQPASAPTRPPVGSTWITSIPSAMRACVGSMLEALLPSPISRIDHDGNGRCDVGLVLGVGIIVSREEQPIAQE